MKQLIKLVLLFFILYYAIQILFLFFGPGHELQYSLKDNDNTFVISEKYQKYTPYQLSNYYITITLNNTVFNYQLLKTNNLGTRIIKEIKYYYDNDYSCIFPIFNSTDIKYDITCLNKGKIFYYHDIQNKNSDLDNFAKSIEDYNVNDFINDESKYNNSNNMFLYVNNTMKDYNLSLMTEHNIFNSTSNYSFFAKMNIFDNENNIINSNSIYTYVANYLVVTSFNESNNINSFILIDLDSNNRSVIINPGISNDMYIQGVVDNSIYLIDRKSKKQYEINVKDKNILVIGTEESGTKYYNNGNWETKSMQEILNNNLKFPSLVTDVTKDFNGYDKVIKYGVTDIGYYYYFKNNEVYASPIKNPSQLTYLFTSNMDKIKYDGDYIYFFDNNILKYYHPQKGLRTLVNIDGENIIDYNIYYRKSIYNHHHI